MNSISLLELQELVRQAIDAMPAAYWVTAEIGEMSVSGAGHCFLELVQHSDEQQRIQARVGATIWANAYRALAAYFADAAGAPLAAGMKIMARVQVQYHALYGLQLNIIDLDPAYTAGAAALQRNRTIARLRSDGIIDMNRELPLPPLPQRIAVISSEQAAGWRDFAEQLRQNPYGYRFHAQLFAAIVQGNAAEPSIIAALDAIYCRSSEFDVVAILRGGGSQSDLSCFDNYNIAARIAQFPLPVITGIGHDKDISVADLAAHTMLKTPTAAAEFLIEQFAQQERYLEQLRKDICAKWKDFLTLNNTLLHEYSLRLSVLTAKIWNIEQERISRYLPQRLQTAAGRALEQQADKLRQLRSTISLLDPHIILQRGYSITLHNGKPLLSPASVQHGDTLSTLLAEGEVHSKVV